MSITASQAAKELGIEPKRLRALLRASDEFTAPGSGASWSFEEADLPVLRMIVDKAPVRGSKTSKTTVIRDDAGLPIKVCRSRSPRDRRAVIELSNARVDRLEQALMAAGLHISQFSPTDRWSKVAV